ncbi:conserved hypothetical protein [Vibrio nigripulchritudo SFn27]|uniref:Competence protein J (ComJ) n=1 Tax=Vibrio nigripulchritudo TaxID=28173 RepID=U4KG90_9VIBR|nr:competence protein ComJ [Vibrio nigripulchritudo]CCN84315.1 conserved hypothetical protein [Vibrio nigripulchritudo BLFn1]CCN91165.1 conserved hypothetical protein [Vibrio nigripulchritudo SFn27]CCN94921.1 conserved hypothetical protein [Vibrio nigripulchritudo ENn2]CCO40007.1 conserved hypothetical protein [Vibrio nigripulchritudo SFn135]CCO55496.1 conserved hypothetical protein [Vibrio nigripulchritudo Wn13]
MQSDYNFDLLISHQQIRLENREFRDSYCEWGKENLSQGCIIHDGFVVFDPIVEGSFGANVNIKISDKFHMDHDTLRCISTHFDYSSEQPLIVSSAFEKFNINCDIQSGRYSLFFEIMEKEEVEYQFTLVPSSLGKEKSIYVIDDDFGGIRNKELKLGNQ